MGINKENIDKLIEVLEKTKYAHVVELDHLTKTDPSTFNMATWYNPCGTPSCIAGHASVLAGMDYPAKIKEYNLYQDTIKLCMNMCEVSDGINYYRIQGEKYSYGKARQLIMEHVTAMFGYNEEPEHPNTLVQEYAGAWLGLTQEDASELFTPEWISNLNRITKEEALITLRILRDEGRVCWTHSKQYNEPEPEIAEEDWE